MTAPDRAFNRTPLELLRRLVLLLCVVAGTTGVFFARQDLARCDRVDLGELYAEQAGERPPVVTVLDAVLHGSVSRGEDGELELIDEIEAGRRLWPMDHPLISRADRSFDDVSLIVTRGVRYEVLRIHRRDLDTPGQLLLRRPFLLPGLALLLPGLLLFVVLRQWVDRGELVRPRWVSMAFIDGAGLLAATGTGLVLAAATDEPVLLVLLLPVLGGALFFFGYAAVVGTERWVERPAGLVHVYFGGQAFFAWEELAAYQAGLYRRRVTVLLVFVVLGFVFCTTFLFSAYMLLKPEPQLRLYLRDGREIISSVELLRGVDALIELFESRKVPAREVG